MGSEATMIMGYGVLITDEIKCFGVIEEDDLIKTDYKEPEKSGVLQICHVGDDFSNDGMDTVVFIRSTVIESDWHEVVGFDPKKMTVPDDSEVHLRIFFGNHGLKFEDPKWLIGVSYG